jgi:AcrR family transcriptional regulator
MATTAQIETPPVRRPRGRPRDPRVEGVVLGATRELLLTKGYGGLTIAAVAEQAGVGKGTIYLRWPDKEALVIGALREAWKPAAAPDTGTLEGDLRAIMRAAADGMNGVPGSLFVSLMGELGVNEGLRSLYDDLVVRPWDAALRGALDRAVARGEVRPGVDARLASDTFWGGLLSVRVLRGKKVTPKQASGLVEIFLAGVTR